MAKIAYSDQTFNTANPIARYAHRTRLHRSLEYAGSLLSKSGTLVDFGCGTGHFLRAFKARRPDTNLIGYEPYLFPGTDAFARVDDIASVESSTVNVLCAFEVLEHLSDSDLENFIREGRRILRADGVLILSVPIIGGPTLLLKETNRMLLFRRKSDYTLAELARAAFLGIPAPRPANRRPTHKGFDFRVLRSRLVESFQVVDQMFCPFSALPWWLNSQVFLTFKQYP